MRNTTFVRTLSCCISLFCLVALGMICRLAFAQDATPAVAPAKEAPAVAALPSDPKELMLLAAKTNGLTGDDVQPWHVEATYQLLDEQGSVRDQGTYEEFWVSPTKHKRTLTGKAFKYSVYRTEKGFLFSGDQNLQFAWADEVRREFFDPLPSPQSIGKNNYVLQKHEAGGIQFACLRLKDANGDPFGPTWCLSADKPLLRISVRSSGEQVLHNRILRFRDRFIAGDLQFVQQGKTTLTAHIDTIEAPDTIDEAIFLPPADAAPQKMKFITISGGVAQGFLIKSVD